MAGLSHRAGALRALELYAEPALYVPLRRKRAARHGVALFYLVFTPCTTWLEHWLTDVQLWNDYLVTALNMVLNLVLEFLYDRFVVFRGTIDSRDAK